MKEILEKISSYNLFNYLFPGIIFCVVSEPVSGYKLINDNIIYGIFLYYFSGLLISRFGSIVIEPVLKHLKFVDFAPYKDYIKASKKDQKIELLSESNNMYRTLISMIVCLGIMLLYSHIEKKIPFVLPYRLEVVGLTVLVLLLLSYRKQTDYVRIRINTILKKEHKNV